LTPRANFFCNATFIAFTFGDNVDDEPTSGLL
jgi:hypothetical protein